MATLHEFRISWGTIDGEVGEERLTYDCMKSHHVRAKCTKLLKKLLKKAEPEVIHYVRFSNQTLGISDSISGYNGRIARNWDC